MKMKISDVIRELKKIEEEHGDLFVVTNLTEDENMKMDVDEVWVCDDPDVLIDDGFESVGDTEDCMVVVIGSW